MTQNLNFGKTNFKETETMGFYDHIEELRKRLMRCLVVFLFGFGICYFFAEPLMAFLRKPLFDALPPDQRKLYFTHLFENFLTHLKIAGYSSIFFFSPYYFYQLWIFIAPGLYVKEKKFIIPFVLATAFFFIGGAAFAYYVLFPVGFKYFITYGGPIDVPMLTIDSYYGICLKLMFLFGVAFELPVLICFLGITGIVDVPFLKKNRRNAILFISVIAALFAPPDAISMLLLGGPLIFLYEGSIWVIHLFSSRKGTSIKDSTSKNQEEEPKYDPFVGKSQ